jgi:hypothetical protein
MSQKKYLIILSFLLIIIFAGAGYYAFILDPILKKYSGGYRVVGISSDGKELLGCRTDFQDAVKGGTVFTSYITNETNTCIEKPQFKKITKEELIKNLQESKDWGYLTYSR